MSKPSRFFYVRHDAADPLYRGCVGRLALVLDGEYYGLSFGPLVRGNQRSGAGIYVPAEVIEIDADRNVGLICRFCDRPAPLTPDVLAAEYGRAHCANCGAPLNVQVTSITRPQKDGATP